MTVPITTIHVSPDDLHAATAKLEETGCVEWADQGGETVVPVLPASGGND